MIDITCKTCGSLYHLSPAHANGTLLCHLCHNRLPSPSHGQTKSGSQASGTFFVVCAFCQHNFSVPYDAVAESILCEHCGKDVNLTHAGQSATSRNINLGDTLIPFAVTQTDNDGNLFAPAPDSISDILDNGLTIAGFRQGKAIGHTPLGTIFEGTQLALQRPVAIYHLHPDLAADSDRLQVFLQEARRSAGFVHPHVARVYDVQSSGAHHFIVSEMIQGKSLESRITDRDFLSVEELVRIGTQTAQALTAAHKRGFLHCGISPANLVITASRDVRVLHFGIGRAITTGPIAARMVNQKNLLLLLSPEQLLRMPADFRSDIYSLGATLYVALTGSLPYNTTEIQQMILQKSVPRPPDILHLCPDLPRSLAELMRRMLQIKPENRPQCIDEVVLQLETVSCGETETPTAHAPAPRVTRTSLLPRIEKRRYKRFQSDMDVQITVADLPRPEKVAHLQRLADLSENGAFILTTTPPQVNSFLRLNFSLEGSDTRINVLGLVRWIDTAEGRSGMGVQFLEVSTEDRDSINRYVDERSAGELIKELTSSQLHKATFKFIIAHWGETVPVQKIMQGTGAGKGLFTQILNEFRQAGLVSLNEDLVTCLRPASPILCTCLLQTLATLR